MVRIVVADLLARREYAFEVAKSLFIKDFKRMVLKEAKKDSPDRKYATLKHLRYWKCLAIHNKLPANCC